jgi:hypothetical protein
MDASGEDGDPQGALFEIEGPDEDGCVWLTGEGGVHVNLGPREAVAEKLAGWLAEIDFGE